jgi:hypothetical protein
MHLAAALDLLVEAYVSSGDGDAATDATLRLADVTGPADSDRLHALVAGAQGRRAALDGPGARDGKWGSCPMLGPIPRFMIGP